MNDFYIQLPSTTLTNVSAHAQLNTDTHTIGFSFWEGTSAIGIPIPLPLTSYIPSSLLGLRKYGLASFQYDTSNGFMLHGTTAFASNSQLLSQAIGSFNVDTNMQTLDWQVLETNRNMVLTPTTSLSSTRIASVAHVTALSWSTSLLDVSVDTLSAVYMGDVKLNVTARGAIDTTSPSKTYSIKIYESPSLSRTVPLSLERVDVNKLMVPLDGARWQQVIIGWVDMRDGKQ